VTTEDVKVLDVNPEYFKARHYETWSLRDGLLFIGWGHGTRDEALEAAGLRE